MPVVRELGVANLAAGVVGLASIVAPTFVLPVAIWAGLFYGAAGVAHVAERDRSRNEILAMVSDLFIALMLAVFTIMRVFALAF